MLVRSLTPLLRVRPRGARALFTLVLILGSLQSAATPLDGQIPDPLKKAKQLVEQLPGLDSFLEGEAPVATVLEDAVTGVGFLDDSEPQFFVSIGALPRNPDGTFRLAPGAFEYVSQSYCLKPGGYAPGRTGGYDDTRGSGEGYLYAPVLGSKAAIVRNILHNSVLHPGIPQRDIQVLLWAIIAKTKISEMSRQMQATAALVLTPEELFELNDGALGLVPDGVLREAESKLPRAAYEVFEAQANLRRMLTETDASFEEIERVAVRAGIPAADPDDQEVPGGRWSYHPNGYYVRYFPSGYSRTLVQIRVPGRARILRDSLGRIARVMDADGNLMELTFDDSVERADVSGDDAARGFAVSSIRVARAGREAEGGADAPREILDVEGVDWLLAGLPAAGLQISADEAGFPDMVARYEAAVARRSSLETLFAALSPEGEPVPQGRMRNLLELGELAGALRAAADPAREDAGVRQGIGVAENAWQWFFCVQAGGCGAGEAEGLTGRDDHRAVSLASASGAQFGSSRSISTWVLEAPTFDPSEQVATPGQRRRQRIGQSARCQDAEDGTPCIDCDDVARQLEGLRARNRALREVADMSRTELNQETARRDGARDDIYGINGSAANFFKSALDVASAGKGKLASAAGNISTIVSTGQGDFGALAGDLRGRALEAARKQRIRNAGQAAQEFYERTRDASGATQEFLRGVRGARWIKQGQRVAGALSFGQSVYDYYNNTQTVTNHVSEYFDARREAQNRQKELDDIDAQMQANIDMIEALLAACQEGEAVGALPVNLPVHLASEPRRMSGDGPVRFTAYDPRHRPTEGVRPFRPSVASIASVSSSLQLQTAYDQLVALRRGQESLFDRFDDLIFPPLAPFVADEWQTMDPAILIELLRIVEPELERLRPEYDRLEAAGREAHGEIESARSSVYEETGGTPPAEQRS